MVRRGREGSAVEMIGFGEGMDTKLRRKIVHEDAVEPKKEEVALRKTKQENNDEVGNRSWPGRWIKKPKGKAFGYEGINHWIDAGIQTWHVLNTAGKNQNSIRENMHLQQLEKRNVSSDPANVQGKEVVIEGWQMWGNC